MKERYGHLTIIEATKERKNSYVVYKCKCDCGNIAYRTKSSLRISVKISKNGGPYCDECAKNAQRQAVMKHGMWAQNARLYRICRGAKGRCEDPKNSSYKDYGARGIKFKFNSIQHMYEWSLENGYADNLSIDRINNDGDYEPSNCRWVDIYTQANNKRDTLEFHGVKGTENIAKYLGISVRRFANMLYRDKMTLDEIYEKSKTDPLFYATNTERRSMAQRKRKDEWKINKEEAIEIVNNIKNGSSINREANKMKVDFRTIKTAIKRLEDGIYDL